MISLFTDTASSSKHHNRRHHQQPQEVVVVPTRAPRPGLPSSDDRIDRSPPRGQKPPFHDSTGRKEWPSTGASADTSALHNPCQGILSVAEIVLCHGCGVPSGQGRPSERSPPPPRWHHYFQSTSMEMVHHLRSRSIVVDDDE